MELIELMAAIITALVAVRRFLKENNLETTVETAKPIMKLTKELTVLEDMG